MIRHSFWDQWSRTLYQTVCDADLLIGNAYCPEPLAGWDRPAPNGTITAGPTTTRSAIGSISGTETSTSKLPHSPEQPGIVNGYNKWHYINDGDGCYIITEKYKIKLSDFCSWNPKVSDNYSGLWLYYYVCIGVKSWEVICTGVFVAHCHL